MSSSKTSRNDSTNKKLKKRTLRMEMLEIRQMLSAANLLHFAPEAKETIAVAYENTTSNIDATTNELEAALLPTSASYNSNLQATNGGRLSSSSVAKGNTFTVTTGTIRNSGSSTSSAET